MGFEINRSEINRFKKAIEHGLEEGALAFIYEAVKITPRDLKDKDRAPKNPKLYNPTGALKDGIVHKTNKGKMEVQVGLLDNIPRRDGQSESASKYGFFLEYGTKKMKARSFLRKTLLDKNEKIEKTVFNTIKRLLGR